MIKDYLKLSYISLKNRRLRSWLTMIGILIGIAAVVSLISLGEGLRETVMGQFDFLSTDILTVQASGLIAGPPGQGAVNPLKEHYVKDIERLNGVDMAIGRIIEDATIRFNKQTDFTFAGSMPDGEARQEIERIAQLELDKGRMLRDKDTNSVVLGQNYRKSDAFGKPVDIRDKVTIKEKNFEVVGFLKKKGSFIVDNIILMNEDVMSDLYEINETYDIIVVKVDNTDEMGPVKERVEKYLRKERDVDKGEEDFTVESPEQSLADLDSILFAIQIFIYVIASISIIVGGIGIANTMYTSVVERTKHIGIMKSIGARQRNIFTLFLIESGLLGLVGGLAGVLIGVIIAYGLSIIGTLALGTELITVQVTMPLLVGSMIFSFVIGSIAGILPALQAAHLSPIDALRHTK